MKTLLRFPVLALLLGLTQAVYGRGKDAPAVRIALVSGDKAEAVRNVLTLAEAKLSQEPGVHLLERQEIDKVLAEQKLSLGGIVAADQVVTVGKLLSVDLFAVLEAGTTAKEVGGLVIFDARTGVRLWDAALPAGELEKGVNATVDAVQAALRKRGAAGKLRPVCLMTVRNADLPRGWDVFCDSVGLLLERQLVASPDLAVLERRRLEQVNKERNLPVDSPLGRLLASVVTIELDIGVAPDGKGLRATALLSDGRGKSLGKVTATTTGRDAVKLSAAVSKELAAALKVEIVPSVGNQREESHRFVREAEFLMQHADPVRSIHAAEAAYALYPDDSQVRVALSRGLLTHAYALINPDVHAIVRDKSGRPIITAEKLELSLALARRGSEVLADDEAAGIEVTMPGVFFDPKSQATQMLMWYLTQLGKIRASLTEDEQTVLASVRANYNRYRQIRIDRKLKIVKDRPSFDQYTLELASMLTTNVWDSFLPAAEWAELLCRLRSWAEIARQYEDKRATFSHIVLWQAVESYGPPRQSSEADVVRLQAYWAELERHPQLTISLYGRLGSVVNTVKFGKLEDAEARRRVQEFRLFVQDILEKGDALSDEERVNVYRVAERAFANNSRLKLPGNVEESKELCEFMLRRKDVFPLLVMANAQNHYFGKVTPERHKYAYEVLQRALEILDRKQGRFLSDAALQASVVSEQAFRNTALQLQAKIRLSSPAAAPASVAPWEKVTTLIDLYPNTQGLLWLQRPVVHDGVVNVAGVRREGNPAKYAVQLLRLTPGQAEKWEGRPMAGTIPREVLGRPTIGPNRHVSDFGTAACVYKDRYYLGTKENGIIVFPFDDGPPERITTADGLPSDAVQSLACLDGRLYACLGEPRQISYVVAWNLKTRKCEVLASSRRKDKRSPLDDKDPIMASTLIPDPARGRLLLILFTNSTSSTVNGLWALDMRSNEFQPLLPLNYSDVALFGANSRVDGDRLLFSGLFGNLVFDLTKKDHKLLFNDKTLVEVDPPPKSFIYKLKALPEYGITTTAFFDVRGPYLPMKGWVWGSFPFSRRRYDTGDVEPLPPLRSGQRNFLPDQCIQMFRGDRELLIGDSFGLWIVTLKKD